MSEATHGDDASCFLYLQGSWSIFLINKLLNVVERLTSFFVNFFMIMYRDPMISSKSGV